MTDGHPYRPLVVELAADVLESLRAQVDFAVQIQVCGDPRAGRDIAIAGWTGHLICEALSFDRLTSWPDEAMHEWVLQAERGGRRVRARRDQAYLASCQRESDVLFEMLREIDQALARGR